MSGEAVVAVDVGKTTVRAIVVEGGRAGQRVERPGVPTVADHEGFMAAVQVLLDSVAASGVAVAAVRTIAAGLAGLGQAPQAAGGLARALQRRCPGATVLLASDVVTSHVGALAGEAGVVLAAGTGSVALAVDAQGRSARVDGWGYLLGDEGSGYAIGRDGLSAVLRAADGRGPATALTGAAGERFGGVEGIVPAVHGAPHPARAVAAFAPAVLAAAGAQDAVALAITDRAAAALARTVRAAVAAPGLELAEPQVALTGGLLAVASPLRSALVRALDDLHVAPARGDALDGALHLAAHAAGPHRALVQRFPPGTAVRTTPPTPKPISLSEGAAP